jgi:hypothetical protein
MDIPAEILLKIFALAKEPQLAYVCKLFYILHKQTIKEYLKKVFCDDVINDYMGQIITYHKENKINPHKNDFISHSNALKYFPDPVLQIKKIKKFDINYNLSDYVNLTHLDCSYSKIVIIPLLPNLTHLDCHNTKVVIIPLLPRLTHLYCNGTEVEFIPLLPNLTHLDCGYTNVVIIPLLPKLMHLLMFFLMSLRKDYPSMVLC